MMQSRFLTDAEDASLSEILDRILDKGIVFDPWIRVGLGATDLRVTGKRIVVASERRRRPFVIQNDKRKIKT